MLAEAFLSGQLHLKQEVDRERWESGDPLNPNLKRPYLFDAIIWDGKYYLKQPPLPGVLHAIWMGLTGKACLTGLVVIALGLGNFLLIGSFLSRIRRTFFPETPMWILTYCWLSFGISGIQLYAIARPVIYHEATLLGNFFVFSGFLVLLVAWQRNSRSLWYPILSGALFGAAVACRLPLILYPIFFALCYAVFSLARNEPKVPRPITIAAWAMPIMGFVSLLLGYNYLRFGSLLDFGDTYVIFPNYMHYIYLTKFNNFYRLAHIPLNLYHYLLALPEFDSSFPFQLFPSYGSWNGERASGPGSYGFDIYHFPRFGIMFPCCRSATDMVRKEQCCHSFWSQSLSVVWLSSVLIFVMSGQSLGLPMTLFLCCSWCYIAARPVSGSGQQAIEAFAWFS